MKWILFLCLCLSCSAQEALVNAIESQQYVAAAGGGGSEFDPSTITGYALDYDVDALGLSTGTTITSLTDKSANKFHLIGAAGPYSTNNASIGNSKKFAQFIFNSTVLQTNFSTTFSQPNTIFMVAAVKFTDCAYCFYYDGGAADDGRNALRNTTQLPGGMSIYSGSTLTAVGPVIEDHLYLWEVHFRGTTSQIITNGVELTIAGGGDAGTQGLHGFTLGSSDGGALVYGTTMEVFRVIVYNADVSGTDLTGDGGIRNYCYTNYSIPR